MEILGWVIKRTRGTISGIQDGVQDGRHKTENLPGFSLRVLFMAKLIVLESKYAHMK